MTMIEEWAEGVPVSSLHEVVEFLEVQKFFVTHQMRGVFGLSSNFIESVSKSRSWTSVIENMQ